MGLAGNTARDARLAETADHLRLRQALGSDDKLRTWESFEYRANSWSRRRRGIARLEVSMRDDSEHLRQEVDIQAENLIELHKRQPEPARDGRSTPNALHHESCSTVLHAWPRGMAAPTQAASEVMPP